MELFKSQRVYLNDKINYLINFWSLPESEKAAEIKDALTE